MNKILMALAATALAWGGATGCQGDLHDAVDYPGFIATGDMTTGAEMKKAGDLRTYKFTYDESSMGGKDGVVSFKIFGDKTKTVCLFQDAALKVDGDAVPSGAKGNAATVTGLENGMKYTVSFSFADMKAKVAKLKDTSGNEWWYCDIPVKDNAMIGFLLTDGKSSDTKKSRDLSLFPDNKRGRVYMACNKEFNFVDVDEDVAKPDAEKELEKEKFRIYVYTDFPKPYVHYFYTTAESGTDTAWPGVAMTKVE